VNGYLIDTHVWLWLIAESPHLSHGNRQRLGRWQHSGELCLSPISAWEVSQKQSKGRLELDGDVAEWVQLTTQPGFLQLLDLTVHDLIASNSLPGTIHGDPADRILVATARERDLTLVTHDTLLLDYGKQGHLRVHKV
jgi:PIN domain nuclease of toxin-antitoxin system